VPKQLRQGTEIAISEDKTITVKPLSIKQLRTFVKTIQDLDLEKTQLTDEDIDRMVAIVGIILEKADPELAKNTDEIEDILDIALFNEILAAAMGADPNA
jgi:hypothetical protein